MEEEERLKVFACRIVGESCDGIILVAAHSKGEAHDICLNDENLEFLYWRHPLKDKGKKIQCEYQYFPWDGWYEEENLVYYGEPSIIEVVCYAE